MSIHAVRRHDQELAAACGAADRTGWRLRRRLLLLHARIAPYFPDGDRCRCFAIRSTRFLLDVNRRARARTCRRAGGRGVMHRGRRRGETKLGSSMTKMGESPVFKSVGSHGGTSTPDCDDCGISKADDCSDIGGCSCCCGSGSKAGNGLKNDERSSNKESEIDFWDAKPYAPGSDLPPKFWSSNNKPDCVMKSCPSGPRVLVMNWVSFAADVNAMLWSVYATAEKFVCWSKSRFNGEGACGARCYLPAVANHSPGAHATARAWHEAC